MRRTLKFGFKPVIGVLHLPPLPGSPGYDGSSLEDVLEKAIRAAKILEEEGLDAIIVENHGDKPYTIRTRNPLTIASIAIIVREIIKETSIPIGINILRNSGAEAYSVAYVTGASFIRVNSYCEVRVAPEGLLLPEARRIESLRARYSSSIRILADVDVKHSSSLGGYDLRSILLDCKERGKADAVIATGSRTGISPEPGYVALFRLAGLPVIVGSGVTPENIGAYWNIADGFIVGTYLKKRASGFLEIERNRAKKLMEKVKELRKKLRTQTLG